MKIFLMLLLVLLLSFFSSCVSENNNLDLEYSVINQAISQLDIPIVSTKTFDNAMPNDNENKRTEHEELILSKEIQKKGIICNEKLSKQFDFILLGDSLNSISHSLYGKKVAVPIEADRINTVRKCIFIDKKKPFYTELRKIEQIVSFSRVLFNVTGNKAVFSIKYKTGELSGVELLIFLSFDNGAWFVYKEIESTHIPI